MKAFLFLILAIILNVQVLSQITFEKTYGGIMHDLGLSVKEIPDEGYITVGGAYNFIPGEKVYIFRTDVYGDTLWTRYFTGTGNSVVVDSDGGFVVCGSLYTTSDDMLLLKLTGSGDSVWRRTFGGSLTEFGYSLQKTVDGGFIACGSTGSFGAQYQNIFLVKTDASGNPEWQKTYSGLTISEGYFVRQLPDENYLICGVTSYITGNDAPGGNSFLLKVSPTGDSIWMKTYPGDGAPSFAITQDNGFMLCSNDWKPSPDVWDILLTRTDSAGDLIWTKTIPLSTPYNYTHWIEKTGPNTFILCGSAGTYSPVHEEDALMVNLNADGDTLWTRRFGGNQPDRFYSVQQTQDDGYILSGYTESQGNGEEDLYLVKTTSAGMVGLPRLISENPFPQIYPNPADLAVTISLPHSAERSVIRVNDLQGITRITFHIYQGQNSSTLDISSLPAGVYLVNILTGERVLQQEKLVVNHNL